MRIVDRKTFLNMPEGTVFAKYKPCIFDEVQIKHETVGDNDFRYQGIFDLDSHDSGEMFDMMKKMEQGESLPIIVNSSYRDGLFDDGQLFAIFDENDVRAIHQLFGSLLPPT